MVFHILGKDYEKSIQTNPYPEVNKTGVTQKCHLLVGLRSDIQVSSYLKFFARFKISDCIYTILIRDNTFKVVILKA